jgi:hypothetical protein
MKFSLTIWTVNQFSVGLDEKDPNSACFAFEWLARWYINKKFPTGAYYQPETFIKDGSIWECVSSWCRFKWFLFKENVLYILSI